MKMEEPEKENQCAFMYLEIKCLITVENQNKAP